MSGSVPWCGRWQRIQMLFYQVTMSTVHGQSEPTLTMRLGRTGTGTGRGPSSASSHSTGGTSDERFAFLRRSAPIPGPRLVPSVANEPSSVPLNANQANLEAAWVRLCNEAEYGAQTGLCCTRGAAAICTIVRQAVQKFELDFRSRAWGNLSLNLGLGDLTSVSI